VNPLELFEKERLARISKYQNNDDLKNLSNKWLQLSMKEGFVYNFDWLGRPIIQYPNDIVGFQEIVWKVKPDLIIETGIAHGGSLILSASLLALLDLMEATELGIPLDTQNTKRKVVGVDIDIRKHNRELIESNPLANRIIMIEGSSVDQDVIDQVKDISKGYKKVLVCLDSMHTHDHVLKELKLYTELVSIGSYCIVYDTFVEDIAKGFFSNRPWDVGDNPKTAVTEFMYNNPEFEIDHFIHNKLQITVAPNGFLKRIS